MWIQYALTVFIGEGYGGSLLNFSLLRWSINNKHLFVPHPSGLSFSSRRWRSTSGETPCIVQISLRGWFGLVRGVLHSCIIPPWAFTPMSLYWSLPLLPDWLPWLKLMFSIKPFHFPIFLHNLYLMFEVATVLDFVPLHPMVCIVTIVALVVRVLAITTSCPHLLVPFHIYTQMGHPRTLTTWVRAFVIFPLVVVVLCLVFLLPSIATLARLFVFLFATSTLTLHGLISALSVSSILKKSFALSMNSHSIIGIFLANSRMKGLLSQIPSKNIARVIFPSTSGTTYLAPRSR